MILSHISTFNSTYLGITIIQLVVFGNVNMYTHQKHIELYHTVHTQVAGHKSTDTNVHRGYV